MDDFKFFRDLFKSLTGFTRGYNRLSEGVETAFSDLATMFTLTSTVRSTPNYQTKCWCAPTK